MAHFEPAVFVLVRLDSEEIRKMLNVARESGGDASDAIGHAVSYYLDCEVDADDNQKKGRDIGGRLVSYVEATMYDENGSVPDRGLARDVGDAISGMLDPRELKALVIELENHATNVIDEDY